MNKRFLLTALLIFLVTVFLSAVNLAGVYDEYEELLNSWINNEITIKKMLEELADLEMELIGKDENQEIYYLKSRVSFLKGQLYYEKEEKELSIRALEKCLYLAQKANRIQETSAAVSTMAEAHSLILLQKGYIYTVANFPVPRKQAEHALELDPGNPRAALVMAQYLCNAPAIAGGNPDEGLRLLNELKNRIDLIPADRFYVLQSITEVYLKLNRKSEAAAACREALLLFPGNNRCKVMLSKL